MTYNVKNHVLFSEGNPVAFIDSPNKSGTLRPLYLLIHYTAGTTADGAIHHFQRPEAQASAHLVLDRDGKVTQMVAFNRIAWHAGKSQWEGQPALNPVSIGIEIVNAGKLSRNGNGDWITWSGQKINAEQVVVARHKNETTESGWQIYTTEQINAVIDIGVALHGQYKFLDVLGHDDVSPGRKVDPGPAFPMSAVQSRIIGRS